MKRTYLPVTLALLLCMACQKEEPSYPLQGHWVQMEDLIEGDYLDILDITDSTTRLYRDRFSPPREIVLTYKDTTYLPRDFMDYSSSWELDKDKLTIWRSDDRLDSIVYTRIYDNELWKEEYFNPLKVSMNLDDWSNDYDLSREEIISGRAYSDLFIGHPKDPEFAKEIFINVNDVFIGLDGLDQWLSVERDMLVEEERASLKVLIHADKSVPDVEIDKILDILGAQKEPRTIYRAGISEEIKDLVYRKIAVQ